MAPKRKTEQKKKLPEHVNKNLIKVEDRDLLDEDPPIKSQNYFLVSFIDPEEIIKQKETFLFEKFMESTLSELGDVIKFLENKYEDDKGIFNTIRQRYDYLTTKNFHEQFQYFKKNADDLEEEYYKKHDFQPTRRGFKIRGAFDSIPEAQSKCKKLRVLDPNHHIHVAQLGTWCLFNPNPDDIADQQYAYEELNTLMGKYLENRAHAKEFFDERKAELIEDNIRENEEKKKKYETKKLEDISEDQEGEKEAEDENKIIPTAMHGLDDDDDPWMKQKKEQATNEKTKEDDEEFEGYSVDELDAVCNEQAEASDKKN
jgi:hypothetical protein